MPETHTDAGEPAGARTAGQDYADRLSTLSSTWWRRLLPVQAPYRWNLKRMELGRTLDVGCGQGRNLRHLPGGSAGVDHNSALIEACRRSGLSAYTPDEFWADPQLSRASGFDSMLLAHVVEHMHSDQAHDLIAQYLPLVRPGGRVVFICPQERGFASDPTHIEFADIDSLGALARDLHLEPIITRSFPFPRAAGKWFTYNEFNVVAVKLDRADPGDANGVRG